MHPVQTCVGVCRLLQLLKLPFMAGVREQREQLQEQQKPGAPTKKQLKLKKQEAKNATPTLVRRAPLRPPPYELDAVDKQLWEAFTVSGWSLLITQPGSLLITQSHFCPGLVARGGQTALGGVHSEG